jgi:WD40 repeat protein
MPNGNVAIAKDNIIKFYNPAKAEFERALTGHVKTIFTLAAHPDGTLFSAGQDNVQVNFQHLGN